DSISELEYRIIELLLLYGNNEVLFEEYQFKIEDEKVDSEKIRVKRKVFEKVFLSLQEDEIEMSNPKFKSIFNSIAEFYIEHQNWSLETYLKTINPKYTEDITSIIMNDESHSLHNWEKQNIIVKTKDMSIDQLVSETILTYRNILVFHLVKDLQQNVLSDMNITHSNLLEEIRDYNILKNLLN